MAEPTPGASPDPSDGPVDATELARLRRELASEKAGAAHWRELARRREAALADLKQRTSVRALLSLERRTAPAREAARRTAAATRTRIEALSVAAAAVPSAGSMPARRRHLDDLVARIDSS
ncbi:MAG: hypothetical protein GX643_17545, partial [Acidimicrobiales bacterium]|nr:hypothetical protein [Acidimicrobiales bacterium]